MQRILGKSLLQYSLQFPSGGFFVPATPLLEKEGDIGPVTLITDIPTRKMRMLR